MIIRTYGWIQNPSDFTKLRKTVEIFDSKTDHYINLRDNLIEREIIYFPEIKNKLKEKLEKNIEEFTYSELVGTSINKKGQRPKLRREAEANALIQISLIPQQYRRTGKRFSDDWTSDGFLRWAVSLNLIDVNREEDIFYITEKGKEFIRINQDSNEEIEFLRSVFLSYPPATRVLDILSDEQQRYFSKFEIGSKLGFIGEEGFTSYDHDLMIDWLINATSVEEVSRIRSDVEGTSDKYARMICSWLQKVGFVKTKSGPNVNSPYTERGFQQYYITGRGLHALKQSKGNSNNPQQEKFLMWEFLGVKSDTRDYDRTRRAKILKILENTKSYKKLLENIRLEGFDDSEKVILSDIKGLNNLGIRIHKENNHIQLLDRINNFTIPNINITLTDVEKSKLKLKEELLSYIDYDEKYIALLDIAYDGRRNLDFEILVTSLFKNVYKFSAKHLGGSRKPDGIAYTDSFGIIFDTKAYKDGYGKNINQADEMIRYIKDYNLKDPKRNPNEWWKVFKHPIENNCIYFLWISSEFIGKFNEQIIYTSKDTGNSGAAINVIQLLIGANEVYNNNININSFYKYFKNSEIIFKKNIQNLY